ncbi:phage tail tip lysozyme [Kribbella sp. NPDC051718]|uniref:phage tail tip lysozyme n=1 Tax=Kribbella sp. NPDC051718 TaxID=3155168 RepID=UPI0034435BA2
MGDSKALPIIGGVMLVFFLPLIIVIAMIVGVLSSMDSAAACTPSSGASETSMAWPTDNHTPDQGWDDEGDETHKGVDFVVEKGKNVYAVEAGDVISTEGDWIKISHGEGLETWYRFFDTKAVKKGDAVTRGQVIGTVGEGNEDAPGKSGAHLHFEVWAASDSDGTDLKQTDPATLFSTTDSGGAGGGCGCGGAGGPLVGGTNQEKAFNFLVTNGYSKEQAAGIVGNMIHESSVEPQRLNGTTSGVKTPAATAVNLGNKAWGIVQWYPASKVINAGRSMGATDSQIETLEFQLNFLIHQLDGSGKVALPDVGTAMKATKTVDDAAYVFAAKFEIFTTDPNDPEYGRRQATAREVFKTFGGGAAEPGKPGAGPATACAAGSGNIAAVAISLAWPEEGHGPDKSDATPAYQAALPKYNSDQGDRVWSDCGRFVSTVMHMSGADPDYPEVGTSVQDAYLRSSPKYQVIDDITEDQLLPGDIFIGEGHTYLFVGKYGKYNSVAGSLGGHVPQAGYAYNVGKKYQFAVARLKNQPAPEKKP